MESQCDYFMYFPAVPFAARELLSGEPGRYRALPRRNHLYLGETVRFLLVLRCRPGSGGGTGPGRPPWAELAASLAALASVSPGGTEAGGDRDGDGDPDGTGDSTGSGVSPEPTVFRDCRALLTHSQGPPGRPAAGVGDGDRGWGVGDMGVRGSQEGTGEQGRIREGCGGQGDVGAREGPGNKRDVGTKGGRGDEGQWADVRTKARGGHGTGENKGDGAEGHRGAEPCCVPRYRWRTPSCPRTRSSSL